MKKNLQKLLAVVMAFAIILGMAACGNSNAPATDAPATEAGKVEDNTPADTTSLRMLPAMSGSRL